MNARDDLTVSIKEAITISGRTFFSIQHIQSAAYFARQASRVEADPDTRKVVNGRFNEQAYMEHDATVTASLFMAASFLEATINELFADAADRTPGRAWVDATVGDLFGRMWTIGVPRRASYSIIKKYEIALSLAGKPPFDPGGATIRDVALLIKLRNALIHYEPETQVTYSTIEKIPVHIHEFEKQLREKFALNPLAGPANPFFPDKCLGSGCAKWAVLSSVRFSDDFFSRMGMKATYDHVRGRLAVD